ncbi:unnamed protein product, partial [Arabidopsis halleri]
VTKKPFACFICKKPFVDPIVTKCNYFCEHCVLKPFLWKDFVMNNDAASHEEQEVLRV